MSVLFFDPLCPKEYSPHTLATEGLGGTEATVVRVAERLAEKMPVFVIQHNRNFPDVMLYKVQYHGSSFLPVAGRVDNVVCLRAVEKLPMLRALFPEAKLFYWMHDLPNAAIAQAFAVFRDTKTTIICVSNWQKAEVVRLLSTSGNSGHVPVKVISNPIDDDLKPDATPVNRDKVCWFSSPHKGLNYALNMFKVVRESFLPDLELHIANPGYLEIAAPQLDGVVYRGALPHHEAVQLARESLCVFYPNTVHPETFGLVFAEANAVGTPVLTHPLGAAYEVLDHPSQIVDCRDPKLFIDRLLNWHDGGRPIVRGRPAFRLSMVARSWENVFNTRR